MPWTRRRSLWRRVVLWMVTFTRSSFRFSSVRACGPRRTRCRGGLVGRVVRAVGRNGGIPWKLADGLPAQDLDAERDERREDHGSEQSARSAVRAPGEKHQEQG